MILVQPLSYQVERVLYSTLSNLKLRLGAPTPLLSSCPSSLSAAKPCRLPQTLNKPQDSTPSQATQPFQTPPHYPRLSSTPPSTMDILEGTFPPSPFLHLLHPLKANPTPIQPTPPKPSPSTTTTTRPTRPTSSPSSASSYTPNPTSTPTSSPTSTPSCASPPPPSNPSSPTRPPSSPSPSSPSFSSSP